MDKDVEIRRETTTDAEKRRRRLTSTTVGERSVLVLRVSTSDSQLTSDAASIADSLFGALVSDYGDDPRSLLIFGTHCLVFTAAHQLQSIWRLSLTIFPMTNFSFAPTWGVALGRAWYKWPCCAM
jgi:hypothetical protein